MFADTMPARAKDFSQSCEEGPRMLPVSMYARPGQRVHEPTCVHVEQTGRSRARMERTSFNCVELCQISRIFCTLPCRLAKGTARRDTSLRREKCSRPYGRRCTALHPE